MVSDCIASRHTVFKGVSDEIPLVGDFDVVCIVQLELLESATLEAGSIVRVCGAPQNISMDTL